MSRRSALPTLLRVAELREAVARADAGRALVAQADATAERDLRARALGELPSPAAGATSLEQVAQLGRWRAEALRVAEGELTHAQAARATAVEGWTETRRRHQLLEGLADRARAARDEEREKVAQRLADDLSSSRERR